MKILIVEDSKSYNNTISSLLRTLGYETLQAFNLQDGIQILNNNEIDYLILDLILPDGEGDDLLFEVVDNNKNNRAKIIILSGADDIQRRNYLFEHGIIEYFSKKIPLRTLVSDIHNLILTLDANKDRTILVVDDSNFVIRSIKDTLESKKYNVLTARSAEEAFVIINEDKTKIDLIFSDVEMPGMSGIEFLENIKNDPKHFKIPIIILSSSSDREIYSRALRHGAVDFIKKPFLIEEIFLKSDLHIKQSESNKEIIRQANELTEYKRVLNESDIISKTDKNGKITYVNDKFCEISGYEREELIGKHHNMVRHPDVPKELFEEMWKTLKDKRTFKSIIKNIKKNGEIYYVDATITPIIDVDGQIIEIIGIRHDITNVMNPKRQLLDDIKNMETPLLILCQIVNYDILKEFYSEDIMSGFEEKFSKTLLEKFPEYTNIKKAYCLSSGLFGFVKNMEIEASAIEACLYQVLKNIKDEGVYFDKNKYGIDIVMSFSNRGNNIYDDVLLGINYALKNKTPLVYADNYYKMTQIEARNKLKMIGTVKDALNEKEKMVSYYQPIVENKTKEIVRYESLIRLINKKNEVVAPFFFLELAKKTGYYHDITLRVIENAKSILSQSNTSITINLSASDIENLSVRTKLLDLITIKENFGRIIFELLEDEDVEDFSIIKDFIALSKIVGGVKIAIDDFGSGYSNFERLLDFQPDILKIDGSLVKNIVNDHFSATIVEAIILFAKKNSIKTVAEFVSDEKTYEIVKDMGIDYSQGYYFGKPEPFLLNSFENI